jgi:methylated-DNA-[protein]-cysteine S-methyltransferase
MITELSTISISTSLGSLSIRGTSRGILSVTFDEIAEESTEPSPFLKQCLQEMEEYFSGNRRTFSVPLVMRGTDFQQRVWAALLDIPFGQTVTYGQLAKEIGHPGAARAVGTAVGDNPLAIIVPCHRVLPASGGIGEYASGSDRKEWLLKHEGVLAS